MTEPIDDDVPFDGSGMTEQEQLLAAQIYECIQAASNFSPRSRQAQSFTLGISDLGTCSERTRRMLAGIPEAEERDALDAFLGTAIGDHVEQAIAALYDNAMLRQTVRVVLNGDGGEYTLTGHPDVVFPWGVIDVKSVFGLQVVQRSGPSQQQLFQRHLYTLGAFNAGMLSCPLEEAKTANVWIDRSGATKALHVNMDTYNPDITAAATIWLDEIVYQHKQGGRVQKEPPREWCAKACGHFSDCRAYDTDVTGLITDPSLLAAVETYVEGGKLARQGEAMKKEAAVALAGVQGSTGEFSLRWSWVNPSDVSFTRKGYDRISVTRMK